MSTEMPMLAQCRFHQERIDKLEDALQSIALSTARIEERIAGVDDKVGELATRVVEWNGKAEDLALNAKATEMRVVALESTVKDSKENRNSVIKWMAGIVAAIITAVSLAIMKLK